MMSQHADTETGPASALARLEPFNRWVLAAGGAVFAVLIALSGRYGFQGDELYFLDCARHLQASYVDQPAFGPLMAWVSLKLFGVSLPGLRLWSALAAGATAVVAGLTAREFGGGRRPQLVAAIAVGVAPALLGSGHIANTTSYMVLATAGLVLIVARIGRTGDPRWWLAAGAVAGLGSEDNHLVGIFAVAVVIGLVLSRGGRLLVSGWFLAGLAIAVAFEVPDLWWQASHGWATIAMTHSLNSENGGPGNIAVWIIGQIGDAGLIQIGLWVAGLRFLWRSGPKPWKALVWAYGLLFVLYGLTTGAQTYYLAGVYVGLIAAGAVALDGWLFARRARLYRVLTGLTALTAVTALSTLPVLPIKDVAWTEKVSNVTGATIGWPQLVTTVGTVWRSLPPGQRANAVIFTADYAEAGAINELGRGSELPIAVSGHNTDWWWGPGNPHATTVVAVAPGAKAAGDYAAYLRQYFTSVRAVATLSNPDGVHNSDWGGHVFLCTGPRQPWGQLWPHLRHYD